MDPRRLRPSNVASVGTNALVGTATSVGTVAAVGVLAASVLVSCSGIRQSLPDPEPMQVVISEIHYADPGGRPSDSFVEVTNTGDVVAPVGEWCIDGVGFCFDEGTVIQPGAALAVDAEVMSGTLASNGETLTLRDRDDEPRDTVTYATRSPWPRTADGIGYSLNRRLPANERASADQWFGWWPSPGAATEAGVRTTPSPVVSVVISEIHYHHPDSDPSKEYIELENAGRTTVDVSGWCVVHTPTISYCVQGATSLPAGGHHLLNGFGVGNDLSDGGGRLELVDATGAPVDTVYYNDRGDWPALADGHGQSLQRRSTALSGLEPGNWQSTEPSPGEANTVAATSLLPTFYDVKHTVSPTPNQPVRVTARVRDGSSASLTYVIGLGEETTEPMTVSADGSLSATIPAQPEGTLIRYRLASGEGADAGTWPRQGDGSRYDGTVVASTADTNLPRLQWFVTDQLYDKVYTDRDLYGDDGYPTVLAYDGRVFDNATIRIKGFQSRSNVKKKWKVVLPPGHEWDAPEFFPYDVNEFGLHSMETDKSMLREVLTSDLQQLSGGLSQRVTPVRMEKNGKFFGLYLVVELPDGRWRAHNGFTERTIVVKAERTATLKTAHLNDPVAEFNSRYRRITQTWVDENDEVRSLITILNDPNREKVLEYVYRHVDVPQVVEAIATMRVVQHFEWAHKNYTLFLDPADEKWRLQPIDHDLNMGNRWHQPCGAFCYETIVYNFDHFGSNRMGYVFLDTPELRAMVDRRTKTLADAFFAEGKLEARITELATLYGKDSARDWKEWHPGRASADIATAQKILLDDYIDPKRVHFLDDKGRNYPPSQKPEISFTVTSAGDGTVTVVNTDTTTIDLSGRSIEGLPRAVPAGVVLNPGQTVVFSTRRVPAPSGSGTPRTLHVWVPLMPVG